MLNGKDVYFVKRMNFKTIEKIEKLRVWGNVPVKKHREYNWTRDNSISS